MSLIWLSICTCLITFNMNRWMACSKESRKAPPRWQAMIALVTKHKLDLVALEETHVGTPADRDSQLWWLARQGFTGLFKLQRDASDKGSSALLWCQSV